MTITVTQSIAIAGRIFESFFVSVDEFAVAVSIESTDITQLALGRPFKASTGQFYGFLRKSD